MGTISRLSIIVPCQKPSEINTHFQYCTQSGRAERNGIRMLFSGFETYNNKIRTMGSRCNIEIDLEFAVDRLVIQDLL